MLRTELLFFSKYNFTNFWSHRFNRDYFSYGCIFLAAVGLQYVWKLHFDEALLLHNILFVQEMTLHHKLQNITDFKFTK